MKRCLGGYSNFVVVFDTFVVALISILLVTRLLVPIDNEEEISSPVFSRDYEVDRCHYSVFSKQPIRKEDKHLLFTMGHVVNCNVIIFWSQLERFKVYDEEIKLLFIIPYEEGYFLTKLDKGK